MTKTLKRMEAPFYTASVEVRSDEPMNALVGHIEKIDLTHLSSRRVVDSVHVIEFSINKPELSLEERVAAICEVVHALPPEPRSDWELARVRLVSLAYELDDNEASPWVSTITLPVAVTERIAAVGAGAEVVLYCAHHTSG